jgi:hypothetical protein
VKSSLAVNFYRAFSFLARPLGARVKEENNNDHGNRNILPYSHLKSRSVSVPSGWVPAGIRDSRLPSSLEDWLASKEALVIR